MSEDYKEPEKKRDKKKAHNKNMYKQNQYSNEDSLEKQLRKCMRCRYFYGNNHRCIQNKCVKEEKLVEREQREECIDCSYQMQGGYCFPCMKKLLGQI